MLIKEEISYQLTKKINWCGYPRKQSINTRPLEMTPEVMRPIRRLTKFKISLFIDYVSINCCYSNFFKLRKPVATYLNCNSVQVKNAIHGACKVVVDHKVFKLLVTTQKTAH